MAKSDKVHKKGGNDKKEVKVEAKVEAKVDTIVTKPKVKVDKKDEKKKKDKKVTPLVKVLSSKEILANAVSISSSPLILSLNYS